jgi:hypothetical protein
MSILSCLSCVHLPMLMVSDTASKGVHSLARFSPITVVVDGGVPYSPSTNQILLKKSGTLPALVNVYSIPTYSGIYQIRFQESGALPEPFRDPTCPIEFSSLHERCREGKAVPCSTTTSVIFIGLTRQAISKACRCHSLIFTVQ